MTSHLNFSPNPQIIEHEVASPIISDDYYQIKVAEAKIADFARAGAHIEQLDKDLPGDIIKFRILNDDNEEYLYAKKIDNVDNANVAKYDTRGRLLSQMANEATYKDLVDRYLDKKNFVTAVNGRGGNVFLTKDDVALDQVDNTSDLDKPISIKQAEVNDYLDKKYKPGYGILFLEEVYPTDPDDPDYDPMKAGQPTGHILITNNFDTTPIEEEIKLIKLNLFNDAQFRILNIIDENPITERFPYISWDIEYKNYGDDEVWQ